MAGNNATNHNDYDVWMTRDTRGRKYAKAYVPTDRDGAVIVLYDWADYCPELQEALLDPSVQDPWKHGLLRAAYKEFRLRERDRKHAARGDHEEYLAALEHDDPVDAVVTAIDTHAAVTRLLAPLSAQERRWLTMTFAEGYSRIDIAREEDPDGDEASWQRRANTIGRSISRAIAKIHRACPDGCPVRGGGEDV